MKLEGRVALITGGNSGIGLATAKLFCAEGASVAIVGRNPSTLLQASSQIGPNVLSLQEDITDPASITRVVEATIRRFGQLDVLFVNAGSGPLHRLVPPRRKPSSLCCGQMSLPPFLLVQAAVPYLKEGSSIIFTESISSMVGRPSTAAYAASKGALRSMAQAIASELSPAGIVSM
jgi:NAD(P)-dependent dehydrogenase (short-subunit alcohol dehydrogenase family)